VEVGHQQVDDLEVEAGRDEDLGFAAGATGLGPGFERAHRGGTDRDHATAARATFANGLLGGFGHLVALGVHHMVGYCFDLDRLEGAGAHMQRDAGALDAARLQLVEQGLVEVQRGGWRRDRAGRAREHGLVAALVLGAVAMFDIGRQRHMAMLLHQAVGLGAEPEAKQRAVVLGPAAQQLGAEAADHVQQRARQRFLADLHVCDHLVAVEHALDQQLDLAARGLLAVQARLDDLGVVEDQQVARLEQAGQFLEDAVDRRAAGVVEQTRAAALGGGVLGHQFGWQLEVEVADGVGARGAGGRWIHVA
jgi:hypothetical protein